MTLITDWFGEAPDIDAAAMDALLITESFGNFAVLEAAEGRFIQAGNNWQSSEEGRNFIKGHDSEPWILEHREAGRLFRVPGSVDLDQVREAFRSYLAGEQGWRTAFAWE